MVNETFLIAATKIRARHHLILPAIGVHPREQQSYGIATFLLHATPCMVIGWAILDQVLITVYMNWVHPWKGIVQNLPNEDARNENDQGNVQGAIEDGIPLLTLNIIQDETNREDAIQPGELQEQE